MASSSAAASSNSSKSTYSKSSSAPCAGCKFLRRKCLPSCIFAPYFPSSSATKFANVHKIFGASNVSKILHAIPPYQREDAVHSLAYEAQARLRNPVYGCAGAISSLQSQVHNLQRELEATNADLMRLETSFQNISMINIRNMNIINNNPVVEDDNSFNEAAGTRIIN